MSSAYSILSSSGKKLVSWCFQPSQPLQVTSGLNRNSIALNRNSVSKLFSIQVIEHQPQYFYNMIISNTHTHKITHKVLQKPQTFCILGEKRMG